MFSIKKLKSKISVGNPIDKVSDEALIKELVRVAKKKGLLPEEGSNYEKFFTELTIKAIYSFVPAWISFVLPDEAKVAELLIENKDLVIEIIKRSKTEEKNDV